MLLQSIQSVLEDPDKFHYKQEWLQSDTEESSGIFELFSFGTMRDIPTNLQLTPRMIVKLQRLTLISLSQTYRELSYSLIMRECNIDSIDIIEQSLIELQSFFKVKLDPIRKVAIIISWYDCRDVYANEKPLTLIQNPKITKTILLKKLEQWQHKLNKQILEK